MEQENDEAIMARVARGDEAAFGLLYDRFSGPLYGLARRILNDEQEAREALQEGFVYLWEKASGYDPAKSRAFSWAVMIFRNKAIDRLRASRRRVKLTDAATQNALDLGTSPEPVRADKAADMAADMADRAEVVRRALRGLPEDQRRCIEWAFFKGYTHHQLAELLGAPLGTIKTNIRRGLLRLREMVKGGVS
jgi:RNA polymerase sigma-70 factor (ECF subfamily)